MTRRGRPKKENAKTPAQASADNRLRKKLAKKPGTYFGDNTWVLWQRYNPPKPLDWRQWRPTGYGPLADEHYKYAYYDNRECVDWTTQTINDDIEVAINPNVEKAIDDDTSVDYAIGSGEAVTTEPFAKDWKTGYLDELKEAERQRQSEEKKEEENRYRERYRGVFPRCQKAVAKHRALCRPLGAIVDIEKIEIVEPADQERLSRWLSVMHAGIVYQIDDWKECKSVVSEYTYKVARGSTTSSYTEQPSFGVKRSHEWNADDYEPMKPDRPYSKRQTQADLING